MGGAEFAGLPIEHRLRKMINIRARENVATAQVELSPQMWDDLIWSLEARHASTFRVDIGPERPVLFWAVLGHTVRITPVDGLGDFEANCCW